MKKAAVAIFLLVLSGLLFSLWFISMYNKSEIPETTLAKSFSYSGAKVLSSEMYVWSKLNTKSKGAEDIKRLAGDFAAEIGVMRDGRYTSEYAESDLLKKVETKGGNRNNDIVGIIVQLNKSADEAWEQYVAVSVTRDGSSAGLNELRKSILRAYSKNGMAARVNSCITGTFDGKLDNMRLNEISGDIFKEADAKKVEGMRDKNLISVSAYTPFIGNSINVSGRKVNLNLAIRYNTYEDKTYIWLATPVITTEY